MSSEPITDGLAVSVRDLGKCYQIYDRPQDRLKQALLRWRGKLLYREFWALRHVWLDVRPGECVGIIGRNGSGKSTLLQMIAGTLRASEGEIQTRGRVAAILELGSGFNNEFTGRENVYINAAILGLANSEVDERFQEIANFAGIGQFIDQPLKTYSSGMVVRLAFAVQALLNPDVLIVDEALAVGDEAFQRKCYGWLERFRENGGTVLFVTHGAQTVVQLCDRALLLDRGMPLALGPSKPVVDIYQKLLYGTREEGEKLCEALRQQGGQVEGLTVMAGGDRQPQPADDAPAGHGSYDDQMTLPQEVTYGTGGAQIIEPAMYNEAGERVNVLEAGQACVWRYRVHHSVRAHNVSHGLMIKTIGGIDVVGIATEHLQARMELVEAGTTLEVEFRFQLNLTPGTYFLNCGVACLQDGEYIFLHRRVDVAAIRVIPPDRRLICGLSFTDPRCSVKKVASLEPAHA